MFIAIGGFFSAENVGCWQNRSCITGIRHWPSEFITRNVQNLNLYIKRLSIPMTNTDHPPIGPFHLASIMLPVNYCSSWKHVSFCTICASSFARHGLVAGCIGVCHRLCWKARVIWCSNWQTTGHTGANYQLPYIACRIFNHTACQSTSCCIRKMQAKSILPQTTSNRTLTSTVILFSEMLSLIGAHSCFSSS